MGASRCLDELASQPDLVARLANTSLKHVADAEVPSDLPHVNRLASVGKGGVARDHEQPLVTRQRGDDVLDDPIGEVLLLGFAAHVLEWQHRYRGLVGQRRSSRLVVDLRSSHHENLHRAPDVLQLDRALVHEAKIELVSHLLMHRACDGDATGLRDALDTSRNVHPIAHQFVALDHDVAEQPSGVLGYVGLDVLRSQCFQLSQCSGLVAAHELRVAHHIGHQDRSEAALLGHSGIPAIRRPWPNFARADSSAIASRCASVESRVSGSNCRCVIQALRAASSRPASASTATKTRCAVT
ncbi:hypothetical protein [Reyranella soli]|uniref:hypothetical protein n=1 Tax=Reyranella soli TaxID=1230389 RepID=UPI0035A24373